MAKLTEECSATAVEPIDSEIIECLACHFRNRVPMQSTRNYRCGNCKLPILQRAQNGTAGSTLTQPIPLKNPKLAFALTCITGPLGFFYISPTLGFASILLFVVSVGIHFGLIAIDSAWDLPQMLVARSAAPYLLWVSFGSGNLVLAFACSGLVNDRNLAVRTGNMNVYTSLQKGQSCLERAAFVFGGLLILPWVLMDLLVSSSALGSAEFLIGGIYFLCPHALAALLSYVITVLIFRWLLSGKQ